MDIMATDKRCPDCGQSKPRTEFWRDASKRDGLNVYCKACRTRRRQDWERRNPERIKERNKRYYQTPAYKRYATDWVRRSKTSRRSYLRNKDRSTEDRRLRTKVRRQLRRARERMAAGTFTVHDLRLLYEEQKGLCGYCAGDLAGVFHVDHKVPLSREGTNWPDNLILACATCNLRKWTRTSVEFLAFLRGEDVL